MLRISSTILAFIFIFSSSINMSVHASIYDPAPTTNDGASKEIAGLEGQNIIYNVLAMFGSNKAYVQKFTKKLIKQGKEVLKDLRRDLNQKNNS